MLKRSALLLAALFAGVLVAGVVSSQATAAPARAGAVQAGSIDSAAAGVLTVEPLATCPANRVCIYANANFGHQFGVSFPPTGGHSNLHAYGCAGCVSSKHPASNNTGGDQMTSWVNNTARNFCGYWNAGFGRFLVTMQAHSSSRGVPGTVNDEMSSLRAC
jgi:hypothetical protein